MAVRVQVTADRLVRGRLEVVAGDATPVGIPVEIPGGSTKEFLLVVPAWQSFRFDGAIGVQARLRDGSTDIAAGEGVLQSSSGQELVGLLPGALGGRTVPGPAPLAIDAGTARFTAIGPAELAQAPASLGPVSTIAAAADELTRLPAATRTALLGWLEQGGHLLVDGDRGQTVEGLPSAWQPGGDGRAAAGRGEVRLTAGAIAAGQWSGLVEPTGWAVTGDPGIRFGNGFVGQALANDAGLRVPRLGWLVAFLVLYVLMAGPVVFFVVRRRGHPELAWVAVPLVAVLFTAGSYVGGRGLRDTTRHVDTSVVATGPAGSTADTWTGVFSSGGQTSRVRFGPGWTPSGQSDIEISTSLSSVTITADGTEGSLPLDAGQFGIVAANGPVAAEGALEVTSTATGADSAAGRVKNATGWALDEVAVFVGTGGVLIGHLEPGEEKEWSATETDVNFQFQGEAGIEFRLWSAFDVFSPSPDTTVDMSLWQTAVALGGQEFRGPGEVVAAGWTRSFSPPVQVDGKDTGGGGRSLILGRNRVEVPAESAALDIRREVVRAPDFKGGPDETFVVRFVTRDADRGGRTPDPARLTLRAPMPQMEVWQDGGWRALAAPAGGRGNDGSVDFHLPAGAVQGDQVFLRFPAFSSIVDVNGLFTLREAP
ncbi:MAG: hypothetical protein QOG82_2626 [Actinomycetota bacterium]|jgi:hypothetical protein|nr:hypothetical protein [Actinomycetota bacterium]